MIKKLLSYLGKESKTLVLVSEVKEYSHNNIITYNEYKKNDLIEKKFSFRNEKKEIDKWLRMNSKCFYIPCGVERRNSPYSWLHFDNTRFVSRSKIKFGNNSAWLGPDYVPSDFRGCGYHRDLIKLRLQYLFEQGFHYAITAINIDNYPSLNNFKKFGFYPVYSISCRRFLFIKIIKIIKIDSLISEKAGLNVTD